MSFGFGVGDFIAVFDKAKKYKDRFRDAPDHLDSPNREITALCAVLQGIDLIKDDLDDYETHALEAPVRECSKLLNEIESLFKADDHSSQQSKVSRLKRIKLDVDQVQKLRLRVSLNVQLLHVVKQFKDSHAIKVIGDQVSTLKDDSANQQRQKFLEWLDRDNYYPQYRKHLERRQQGSCQWFLESTGVQTWIANKGDGLLCHGIPGCGKTVISSIVIDHLFRQFERDKNIGIMFIFCDAQDQEEGTFHRYVSNVTKQLVQAQSEIPASVRELYEMHQKLHSSRREMETVDLLFRLATTCTSRLFIIVDGLDECQPNVLRKLIQWISQLQRDGEANVLLTTRPIPEIVNDAKLSRCRYFEIRARDDDVRQFVSSSIPSMRFKERDDPLLQKEITSVISKRAEGMFLLAELMVESVKDMRTPRQVRKALYGAPRRYTEYYNDAWMRVKKQNETDARLAMSVISWVVCAKRPLGIAELQHALATEDEEQIYEDNIFSVEDILSVCLGLVRVDAHSNVRLVHQTNVEFFEAEKNNAGFFQSEDAEMASICVRYLSFDQTRRSAERYSGELQNIHFGHTLDKNIPFGQYAAEHWGDHARDARRFPYCVWEFLDNPAALATSWKMFTKARTGKVPLKRAHIAALFGILHVFEGRFLTPEETFAYEGDPRRMPLYFAVREGHADVVKLLLDSPALLRQLRVPETFHENVFHSQNPAPHSAIRAMLAEAVEVRSATTVDVLIKFCAREQLRAEVPRETWPLVDRASREDTSVLKALVGQHNTAEGFSIETIAELGLQIEPSLVSYTPLLYAASKGNVGVVELLWRIGANHEARDGLGKTPLRCAVESGRLDVVIRLHNYGAKVDVEGREEPLLSLAARSGNVDVVCYVINNLGQNPNEKNVHNHLPVQSALSSLERCYSLSRLRDESVERHEEVVKVFLSKLDIDNPQSMYQSDLQLALENQSPSLPHYVASEMIKNSNPSDPQPLYHSIMRQAIMYGKCDIVDLLISHADFDINRRSENDTTALEIAQEYGFRRICETLLNGGAVSGDIETLPTGLQRVKIPGGWYYWKRRR